MGQPDPFSNEDPFKESKYKLDQKDGMNELNVYLFNNVFKKVDVWIY